MKLFCHALTCDDRPKFWNVEGADHCGVDHFLRCSCGLRTECHVEGHALTDEIRRILHKEWRSGRITYQARTP